MRWRGEHYESGSVVTRNIDNVVLYAGCSQLMGAGSTATRSMSDWNPTLYMKFEDERMRAARDFSLRFRSPPPASSMIWAAVQATAQSCWRTAFPMRGSSVSTPRTPCSHTRATGAKGAFRQAGHRDLGAERAASPDLSPMPHCISCPFTTGSLRVSPLIWHRAAYSRPRCRTMPASLRMR